MATTWCPAAKINPAPTYRWGPAIGRADIGLLHSTESLGRFVPQPTSYFGHTSYPHFTASWELYQHIPIDRAAKALRNLPGGIETNNDLPGVIQIEIDWRAADMRRCPAQILENVRTVVAWLTDATDIPRSTSVRFHEYPPEDGHRLGQEPWRLRGTAFTSYRGWLGHQHTDENVHGDPGPIDIDHVLGGLSMADIDTIIAKLDRLDRMVSGLDTELDQVRAGTLTAGVNTVQEITKQVAAIREALAGGAALVRHDGKRILIVGNRRVELPDDLALAIELKKLLGIEADSRQASPEAWEILERITEPA